MEVITMLSFEKRISIKNTTVDKVYAMWATINGMEQWFLKMCAYKKSETDWYSAFDKVEAGALYSWYWHGYSNEVCKKGKFIEANGINHISFSFGQKDAEEIVCTVNITAEQDEIICSLLQTNIPSLENGISKIYVEDICGWTFYLTNLKSIVEGGIDLRNKNESIKNVLNS